MTTTLRDYLNDFANDVQPENYDPMEISKEDFIQEKIDNYIEWIKERLIG